MYKLRNRHIFTAVFALLVAFLFVGAASAQPKGRPPGGGGGKSAAVFITKFIYSTDAEGKTAKVAVDPGTKIIYAVLTIGDPAPGSTFKFVWTLYDEARQQTEVFSQEFSNQSGKTIACKYAPPGGLKKGTYTVQIFIDGRGRNRARLIVLKNQT